MYINIPADAELNIPWMIRAIWSVLTVRTLTADIPVPIATPAGIERKKKIAIIAINLDSNFAYNHY